MKAVIHKILSFAMALLVLFSTLSFTVDMHFCGDKLVEIALLHKTEGCAMATDSSADTIQKDSCCSDQQLVVQGQDELSIVKDFKLSTPQEFVLLSYLITSLDLFKELKEHIVPFKDYQPPRLIRDIIQQDQTLLI